MQVLRVLSFLVAKMSDKAGLIPYFQDGDDEPRMAFMVTSNPRFGGAAPMIAKGHIDEGEAPDEAAIREAEEELGLRRSNMLGASFETVWRGALTGLDETYKFYVYAVRVKSMTDFDEPDYETEKVVWLTSAEFEKVGRTTQRHIVALAAKKIRLT